MEQHSEAYSRILRRHRRKKVIRSVVICVVFCAGLTAAAAAIIRASAVSGSKVDPVDYIKDGNDTAWIDREAYITAENEEVLMLKSSIESYNDRRQECAEEEFKTHAAEIDASEDDYLLARIAMAEAERESTETKALVILTVLNRVRSGTFPDTVKEVIFQDKQFTPVSNGRWERSEPNEDCWKALAIVKDGWDESRGALYFETTTDEPTWHSRTLKKLFESGRISFYTEYRKEDPAE